VKPFQLGLSLIPVVIIVIGLIGWVVTLRGNIDSALGSIQELQEAQYDDTDLVERVQDLAIQAEESMTKVMWVMEEYGPAIESIRDRELDTEMADRVADIVTRQAVVENEMRQIMSDHSGFADVLYQLGESGLIETKGYPLARGILPGGGMPTIRERMADRLAGQRYYQCRIHQAVGPGLSGGIRRPAHPVHLRTRARMFQRSGRRTSYSGRAGPYPLA